MCLSSAAVVLSLGQYVAPCIIIMQLLLFSQRGSHGQSMAVCTQLFSYKHFVFVVPAGFELFWCSNLASCVKMTDLLQQAA